jgi:hypothetical protein
VETNPLCEARELPAVSIINDLPRVGDTGQEPHFPAQAVSGLGLAIGRRHGGLPTSFLRKVELVSKLRTRDFVDFR